MWPKSAGIEIAKDPRAEMEQRATRPSLKTLQPPALDKENVQGHKTVAKTPLAVAKAELKNLMDKCSQTEMESDELVGETASAKYWELLANKRAEELDKSFHEIEVLKDELFKERHDHSITQEMLEEARSMVQVVKEILGEAGEECGNE